MSEYTPDKWLMIKLTHRLDGVVHYRIFGVWYGGFAGSDYWKMNSGVTQVTEDEYGYHFSGVSGSVYHCNRNVYGSSGYGTGVLNTIIAGSKDFDIEILPETTNFMELKYIGSV
jgi:hypothetical protein